MGIADLYAALKAEFETDVTFYPNPPPQMDVPSVAVMPADPFLEIATHGAIRETWDILVAVGLADTESAVLTARDLSLRVLKAASEVGAVWGGASGLTVPEVQSSIAVVINSVSFKYATPS